MTNSNRLAIDSVSETKPICFHNVLSFLMRLDIDEVFALTSLSFMCDQHLSFGFMCRLFTVQSKKAIFYPGRYCLTICECSRRTIEYENMCLVNGEERENMVLQNLQIPLTLYF